MTESKDVAMVTESEGVAMVWESKGVACYVKKVIYINRKYVFPTK